MKVFLTSDLHFGHENIIKYCNRPYKDIAEMDKCLIDNWNSVVGPNDLVYNLGDLCMPKRVKKDKNYYYDYCADVLMDLNGRHVLILGNHDYLDPFKYIEIGIESVHTSLIVGDFVLAHDPSIATAIPKKMSLICGHVHDTFVKLVNPKKVLNVGVDCWDYKPIEWSVAAHAIDHMAPSEYDFDNLEKFGRHKRR